MFPESVVLSALYNTIITITIITTTTTTTVFLVPRGGRERKRAVPAISVATQGREKRRPSSLTLCGKEYKQLVLESTYQLISQ